MMEKPQGCHCKLLPGQRGTGGTAKGGSGGSTLLGFSSVRDTLFSAVPLAATAWKAQGLSVCFTRRCGTKQTHDPTLLHQTPPNTPACPEAAYTRIWPRFTCGLWRKRYGMIGVFMGLSGTTKVPAVVWTLSKGRCPSPRSKAIKNMDRNAPWSSSIHPRALRRAAPMGMQHHKTSTNLTKPPEGRSTRGKNRPAM